MILIITAVVWTLIYPHLKSSQRDMYFDNEDDMKKGLCSQKEEDEEFIKSFMYNDSLILSVCLKQKLLHDGILGEGSVAGLPGELKSIETKYN